jgi:hypothetical protein
MDQEPLGGPPVPPAADEASPPPDPIEPPALPGPPDPIEPPVPPAVPPGPPPFTVRDLLKDSFGRYAADWRRLLVVALLYAGLSLGLSLIEIGRATGGLAAALAYTIISFSVTMVGTSVLFALVGLGPEAPLFRAVNLGIRRSIKVFLTLLAMGILVFGVAFVVLLVTGILLRAFSTAYFLLAFATVLVAYWFVLRFVLAVPAVVVDGLGVSDSLSQSRRVTRPIGVWLRMVGSILLTTIVVGAAAFSAGLLMALSGSPWVVLATGLATAFVTPFGVALIYSSYRRLVPAGGLESTTDPSNTGFVAPVFGRAAKVLLGVTLAVAVVGVAAIPVTWQLVLDRFGTSAPAAGDPNRVAPGKVAFGTSSTPAACSVQGQRSTFASIEGFAWLAAMDTLVGPTDKVKLRLSQGGTVLGEVDQPSGPYLCLGPLERETDFPTGVYLFEVVVNGQVRASGTVTIT